jgi:hypothetical protein
VYYSTKFKKKALWIISVTSNNNAAALILIIFITSSSKDIRREIAPNCNNNKERER